ncbi:HAD family hydrolase [Brevibacterium spongiae]|uniref:HAD family phosphatase n=1 Tax=Brevibacterium spongiae TaxID=2909672 RepID=A0ABY5SIN3_9MICO|nr:HAD family phosphatase [Brevibacterium spongiae]UVI34397.1 HAD family phosphatase [Brevibacterium spongiae]
MTNSASAEPAAVLWDMDGTLVDTEPYWIRAETELMNAHGLPWSEEQGLEFVGNELTTSAAMMQDAGLDLPVDDIVETLMSTVIDAIRTSVPFRPGALDLLAELTAAGIPNVMVTMSYRRLAEAVIASCPAGSFAGLIAGDEVSAGKPDPEPYLKGAALLDLAPGDCVALEDSKPGLASAEAAGTIAVGIPHLVDLEARPGRILWDSLEGRTVEDLRRLAQRSSV